jgi:DNA mismatch repair protein MutL
VVYLTLPAADLDVNVHPQKREVRFSDARAVFGFIRKTISQALSGSPWLSMQAAGPVPQSRAAEARSDYRPAPRSMAAPLPYKNPSVVATPRPPAAFSPPSGEIPGFFSGAAVLGQLFATYILCEKGDDLVVIDQHAAAERITYEKLRDQYRKGGVRLQTLLLPSVVSMDEKDLVAAEENEGLLRTLGIDASASGRDCMTVRAVPALLGNVDPAALLREAVDQIRSLRGRTDEAVEALLQTVACHGSVRAGRRLEPDEIRALLAAMDRVDFAAHCPHGRPVFFTIPRRDIESRLKRS